MSPRGVGAEFASILGTTTNSFLWMARLRGRGMGIYGSGWMENSTQGCSTLDGAWNIWNHDPYPHNPTLLLDNRPNPGAAAARVPVIFFCWRLTNIHS